jgi:hypothetical protein
MVPPVGAGWFENDEPLDAKRELFLERLRVLATRWSWCTGPHTFAFPRQASGALDLAVDVLGRDGGPVVMTLAIHYESDSVRCSTARKQPSSFDASRTVPDMRSSGDPRSLAYGTATWIQAAARRALVSPDTDYA